VGAVALDRAHFHFRRVRRHDDVRRYPAEFRRARERSAMISRRVRRDAAQRGHVIERKDRVCRAARLERANLLKIFALEKQRRAARIIQSRACQHRRIIDVQANPLMRRADAIKIKKHHSILSSTGRGSQETLPHRFLFPHLLIHPALLYFWFLNFQTGLWFQVKCVLCA
jgi:hypothetical protein